MIIRVRVIPNSKVEALQKLDTDSYKLKVREKAIGGRANAAVIDFLSSYFKVKKADVRIIKGATAKDKRIEVG